VSPGLSSARDLAVQQAVVLRDALLTDRYDQLTPAGIRSIRMLTAHDDDCRAAPLRAAWLDSVCYVAAGTATSLAMPELASVWSRLQRLPCVTALLPQERAWFELMHAVAMRDSATVLARGLETLQSRFVFPSRDQFLYALTATSAAAIAQQQPQLARQLLETYRADEAGASAYALALRMLGAVVAPSTATAPAAPPMQPVPAAARS